MVRALKNLQMVIAIREPTQMVSPVAMDSIAGQIVASLRVTLKMV